MWGLSNKTKLFSMYFSAQEIEDLERGIRKRLNSFLLRFDEDLGGVMIEYSNLQLLEQQMHISSNRTPYLHCEVVVDAIIFNPKPGKQLIGQINHFTNDFLSLLVYGVFNAAITADRIRANFVKTTNKWVNQDNKKEQIAIGTWVIFEVVQVDRAGSIFGIAGSMLEPSSGPVITSKKKHAKSSKQQQEQNKLLDHQEVQIKEENSEHITQKKSKKRKKRDGEDGEEKSKKKKKSEANINKTEENTEEVKIEGKTQPEVRENGLLQNGGVIEILEDGDDHENDKIQKRKDKKEKKTKKKGKKEKALSNDKATDGTQQQHNIDGKSQEAKKKKRKNKE